MLDLFGRKRIRQLEEDLRLTIEAKDRFMKENSNARVQVEYLVRTIRDMDQEIWNMAQRMDWTGMRPHFIKLQEGMTERKHAENERINSIIRGELIDTYKPNDGPKQIGKPNV